MPNLIVYTNPLTPGICAMPVYTVGDDQNWSLQFNNGTNFYNPTGVSMNIGFVRGLGNLTYSSGFSWVDRMNNQHTGSFSIAVGVPSALTWDEDPIGVAGGNGAYLIRGRVPPSGTIRKVYVKYGGTGISTAPAVRFNGGAPETGQAGTATVTLGAGAVTGLTVTSPGRGYSSTNPPEVIITGDGTGARVKIADSGGVAAGHIVSFTVVTGGSGYTTATATIRDAEATATATVGGTSTVTAARLVNPGSGYTSAPTIAFSGGGGASAAATAALANSTWGLSGLTLTGAGTGYTTAPTVIFSGGTGSGAAAVAIISGNGGIGSVTVTNGGSYSTGEPNQMVGIGASFSGGGGSGATGYCIFTQDSVAPYYYSLTQVVITNAGTGYTSAPTFAVGSTSSSVTQIVAATGTAVVTTGTITSLMLTNPGSGYGSTAPTVGFTGGAGSGATATAQLIGSPLSSVITMTNNGSGYTSPPLIAFSGGAGSGATATAVIALGITAITMTQGGYAYTSLPALSLVPDNGAVLIASGIESHTVPFLQNFIPATAEGAITATPYTNGRRDSSGSLVYDDSLLIVRPRYLVQPTLTLQGDALTWAGMFNPATVMVQAVLNYRRSFVADVEIFGGGRLLFTGSLTIAAA